MTHPAKREFRPALRLLARWLAAAGLLIGCLPQAARSQDRRNPPPAAAARTEKDVEHLLRLLDAGIRQSDTALRNTEGRIPPVRDQIQKLTREVQSLRPPQPEPPPPQDKAQKEVKYRPPMEKFVQKDSIDFVCEEGRISIIDFEVVTKYLNGLTGSGRKTIDHNLPDSDFSLSGYVELKSGSIRKLEVTVVRKPGCPGETWEEIQRPASKFQKLISSKQKGPSRCVVSLKVWPDSYELFRRVRELAWEAGYDVGWTPMSSGERMKLGRGAGITGVL